MQTECFVFRVSSIFSLFLDIKSGVVSKNNHFYSFSRAQMQFAKLVLVDFYQQVQKLAGPLRKTGGMRVTRRWTTLP